MTETLTGTQVLIRELTSKYDEHLGDTQPMLKRSMVIAYQKGVSDALEWVRKYNQTVKPNLTVVEKEPS